MTFLKIKDVITKTALSEATVYRLMSQGDFPKNVRLSPGRVAWVEEHVDDWQRRRIRA